MSEFTVPVVRIGAITKHPNADTLSTTVVEGETVIIKTGDFQEGDVAVYVPVDAVVPRSVPGTEFLGDHRRIRAKRLRGVYSEGLLLPMSVLQVALGDTPKVIRAPGDDMAALLGIKKHEDAVPDTWATSVSGASLPSRRGLLGLFFHWCFKRQAKSNSMFNPGVFPEYDVEPYKKNRYLLNTSHRVAITEKLHGTNARYGWHNLDFYIGSHYRFIRDLSQREPLLRERLGEFVWKLLGRKPRTMKPNLYVTVAKQYNLAEKMKDFPRLALYGEIYGEVQDMKYNAAPGQVWFRVFDIYDTQGRFWLPWETVKLLCEHFGLETVPVIYEGIFDEQKLAEVVEGKSLIADHFREGVVVKTTAGERVNLKWVSQTYKLRKGGTELH